ncbi:MAG TPA: uracil-DNA glycosylase family protein [Saprospiraceae bacterium]|nr:uracil-DNA glycosylase family protein [Saprospiraceae bacterium]HMQ83755.1 uracil-DNA glycosylase family protein [Saprospiraceae bacterium]
METLLKEINQCNNCANYLPHGCRPVVQAANSSKILIIGQAPGRKVFLSGIAWDDASGDQLRDWLGVSREQFYDPSVFALMPMGFCYPGTGKSGDLPPRPECAPLWHDRMMVEMGEIQLTLLIGRYAQQRYLFQAIGSSLTDTVKKWQQFIPEKIPMPHPSPRNRIWLAKNPWFEVEAIPWLKSRIKQLLQQES